MAENAARGDKFETLQYSGQWQNKMRQSVSVLTTLAPQLSENN